MRLLASTYTLFEDGLTFDAFIHPSVVSKIVTIECCDLRLPGFQVFVVVTLVRPGWRGLLLTLRTANKSEKRAYAQQCNVFVTMQKLAKEEGKICLTLTSSGRHLVELREGLGGTVSPKLGDVLLETVLLDLSAVYVRRDTSLEEGDLTSR